MSKMLVIPDYNENALVKKANDLIEARYKLSIGEQRLILLLASQIHPDDEDFEGYDIRVQDFAEMFGLKTDKSLYEKVEESAKELLGKQLYLKNDSREFEATVWLSYVKYIRGSGIIKLAFHPSLKPYLLKLKDSFNGFTKYQIGAVMKFKSTYSIRLYELLKKDFFKAKNGTFERTFTLEEYKKFLGVENNEYPAFENFRRRVIEPPAKEISDNTDLNIFEVRYIKTGRKITGIHFIVLIRSESETSAQVAQLQLGQTPKEKPEVHPAIQSLMNYGFTFEKAKSYKNKYGVRQIERSIAYMLAEEKNKPILNKAGYLNKAIHDDYGNALELEEQKKKEQLAQKKAEEERKRQKEQEQERKREEDKIKRKKVLDEFFSLSEKMRGYVQTEFENHLREKKTFEAILTKWQKLKNEKEMLIVDDVGYRFYRFVVENGFL